MTDQSLVFQMRRYLGLWWIGALWIFAILTTSHKALWTSAKTYQFAQNKDISNSLIANQFPSIEMARAIQREYLGLGLYIPTDDIVTSYDRETNQALADLSMKVCGSSGPAFIWIPLRFQLPILGEKVLEWCQVKT